MNDDDIIILDYITNTLYVSEDDLFSVLYDADADIWNLVYRGEIVDMDTYNANLLKRHGIVVRYKNDN